ncbi:MAG: hypothetical protein HHJ17_03785 [Rhodoferax sp.]|uniref:YqjK-like family protein n=1 Tax=Rhodoferax sp. TaxID=50421 RepID=UPI00182FC125|nr:YqjK-like family protein [Rhodoferax sp.]NMM12653.1 hypothetical protein [Rhodoferax sp.]NMM19228.1 hypothetical protein [Rhodoferax sp.]
MSNDDLVQQQQRLLMRSVALRNNLTDQAQVFKRPLAVADQARAALQWLYRNPQWPIGALVVVAVLKPQRAIIWSSRFLLAWRSFKRVRNWISKLPMQTL